MLKKQTIFSFPLRSRKTSCIFFTVMSTGGWSKFHFYFLRTKTVTEKLGTDYKEELDLLQSSGL